MSETRPVPESASGAAAAQALKDSLKMGKDAFGRSQIFGEPVVHGDVVVIPVGRMRGGAGGGGGSGSGEPGHAPSTGSGAETMTGEGAGHGWGMDAKATGAYVIHGDKVSYMPAVEVSRIVVAGIVGTVVGLLLVPRIIRAAKD
jgi:uncharacterized spore protein YtfJ